MPSLLTRERFGMPQVIALILLLLFLVQCLWFALRVPLSPREAGYLEEGRQQWRDGRVTFEAHPSPATALFAALPAIANGQAFDSAMQPWKVRLPFMIMGTLLGASLWYVARRLYANPGGYIALALYAFSPQAVIRSATVHPGAAAAWGAFGAIFTAIAVAHTLYAPREVVLWNWRRILLLGVSIGLATASQLSLIYLLPLALVFMLYLVPERRAAALTIFSCSCVIGLAILLGAYGLRPLSLLSAARESRALEFRPEAFMLPLTYINAVLFFARMPAMTVLLAIALAVFAAWKHTRYFGTWAPLIVFLVLLVMGFAMPHAGSALLYWLALPFAFVFIAGICADLLKSRYSALAMGTVGGLLLGHVIYSLAALLRF